MIYLVPMPGQPSATFYISFLLILWLLKNRQKGFDYFICSFMATGVLTSYIDLLMTPVITLGLPLTIYILLKRENAKGFHKSAGNLFVLMGSWLFGYAANWVSKWLLAAAILRDDTLEIMAASIAIRTSNRDNSPVERSCFNPIQKNLSFFFDGYDSEVMFVFVLILLSYVFLCFFSFQKKLIL